MWGGVMLSFSHIPSAKGQVLPPVNPQAWVSNVTTLSASKDDIAINSDMLAIAGQNMPLRAIVWDEGSCVATSPIGNVHLYLEDPSGNKFTTSFVGAHPDVVLGDDPQNPGKGNYRLAVAYVNSFFNYQIDFYTITALGTPGFHATYTGFKNPTASLSSIPPQQFPLYDSRAMPHIDMFANMPGTAPGGLCALNKYIVTYEENDTVYYQIGDILGTTISAAQSVGAGIQPDVSTQIDVSTGMSYAYITYLFEYMNGINLQDDLYISTIDVGTGAVSTTLLSPKTLSFNPRIESMSLWGGSDQDEIVKWQIVVSQLYNFKYWQTFGYNDNNLSGFWLSNSFNGTNCKANAVAAGIGSLMPATNIGNTIYATGFFVNQQQAVYAKRVDAATGTPLSPVYQINNSIVATWPVYSEGDAAKSLSLSTCSNSGAYILAVWYDGMNQIFQKLTPIGNIQFRPTGLPITSTNDLKLYPNPATNSVQINQRGKYIIYSVDGRIIKSGYTDSNQAIDVSILSSGMYFLSFKSDNFSKIFSFVKQN